MLIKRSDFDLYEQVILTEQMPPDRAVRLMEDNPDFASWYKERMAKRGEKQNP